MKTTDGHLILTVPEQQFIYNRFIIESKQGLDVYEQSDLDIMTSVMNKLDISKQT